MTALRQVLADAREEAAITGPDDWCGEHPERRPA